MPKITRWETFELSCVMTDGQALDLNQTTNNTLANGFLKWVTKYHLYRL